jgi:hypothetical protein
MVYGEPLTLPGEILDGSDRLPTGFLQWLRQQMSDFVPPASRPHPPSPLSCRPSLCTSLSHTRLCRPLQGGGKEYFFVDVGEARSLTWATLPFKQLGQCPPQGGVIVWRTGKSSKHLLISMHRFCN